MYAKIGGIKTPIMTSQSLLVSIAILIIINIKLFKIDSR